MIDASLDARLDQLVRRHDELGEALSGAGISGADFVKLSKEYSELSPIVETIAALRRTQSEISAASEMAGSDDAEMRALAEEELEELREHLPELEMRVRMSLVPKDADDERNAILEVRAGTGGEEAALFAAELFRMYQRYAALRGWKFELLDLSETGIGGFKEATASNWPVRSLWAGSEQGKDAILQWGDYVLKSDPLDCVVLADVEVEFLEGVFLTSEDHAFP